MTAPLDRIKALGDPQKAAEMAAYHKAPRTYLGVPNPILDDIAREMRQTLTLDTRIAEAQTLWETDVHESRVLAAKLFTQARIRPDDAVWETICNWVPTFDAWAVADHACMAGQRRLIADPTRLDIVETWTTSGHMWARRAALVMTLPWTKQNQPKPAEEEARDRILGWAAIYVNDPDWFIQKAVAWWLRELSKHDAPRVRSFLTAHGDTMKPFARKEAARKLPD
ncbi:DNA alkylation repair protein [Pseudaestuariivita sp.]|uniref:DNA alkylation repair protein n=1 Tax=Pseudaestuariivita sp. TaxID=2211669 RepID=UPI0040592251